MHPKLRLIIDRVVEELQAGRLPWKPPYNGGQGGLPVRFTGEEYRGTNVIMLWVAAMIRGYDHPMWMTYNQARKLGGHVRKDEESSVVMFTESRTAREKKKDGEDAERSYRVFKLYPVFNVAQLDGLPPGFYGPAAAPLLDEAERDAAAEAFVRNIPAEIEHMKGGKPCYMPGPDRVRLPAFAQFNKASGYYGTIMHELGHWTGHPSRLNREYGHRFGDDAYAQEELVAELISAFTCASLGIEPDFREDVAPYLGHWAERFQDDYRTLLAGGTAAQKGKDLLFSFQPGHQQPREGQEAPAPL